MVGVYGDATGNWQLSCGLMGTPDFESSYVGEVMSANLPPVTETIASAAAGGSSLQRGRQALWRWLVQSGPQLGVAIGWAGLAAIGIGHNSAALKSWERQMQRQFWLLRGPVAVPQEIVIVGIDTNTLNQVSSWPLDRGIYAQTIDKLLGAGAKGVAIDILFDVPRGAGQIAEQVEDCTGKGLVAGDRALRESLQRQGDRVTLATSFELMPQDALNRSRLIVPYCAFPAASTRMGSIDFRTEGAQNSAVFYQLGDRFLAQMRQQSEVYQMQLDDYGITSFATAALRSAKLEAPPVPGDDIFFYGGRNTFTTVSLADVVQSDNWQSRFQSGEFFRNKLVLIGVTDDTQRDITDTPLGRMSGVELQANAIATTMQGRALRPVLANSWLTAGVVFVALLGAAGIMARAKQPVSRLLWLLGLGLLWAGAGFGLLTQASLLWPMVLPLGAIGATGLSYVGLGVARDQRNRRQLESSLKDRSRDPVVRDIINQQTDETLKQSLLQGRQQELLGARIGSRYQIIQIHAAGGFGETYIAEDTKRPGQPKCVVKKLSPASSQPKHLALARRLFEREAETLEKLGKQHDQIPQLLAYFEEETEFYLVQEFIEGHPLNQELPLGHQLPETQVLGIMREVLQILGFVHSQSVIHRDIKPSNLIRRDRDNRLVLIDFGAVKGLQVVGDAENISDLTIGIGTQGYMAPEQQAGHPQFNSDIYAVGMMGVQMLTGISPSQLPRHADTGEIDWLDKTHASVALVEVVQKMIAYHYKQRFQSTEQVLQDLKKLSLHTKLPEMLSDLLQDAMPGAEEVEETQPWPTAFDHDGELPPTAPPPTM
jgi:CHASE2 domain-containing sensor protein/tRNA A-37 threonylcarbamoyl transferase component Bud32